MSFLANTALVVIPKKGFVEWLIKVMEEEELSSDELKKPFEEIDVYNDCLIYLMPLFENKEQVDDFVKKHYTDILTSAMSTFVPDKRYWPKKIDFELFDRYFSIEFHTRIVDLSSLKQKDKP